MIKIRHARLDEKKKTYEWLCLSDTAGMHMGEPNYPESPIPNWEEFQEDFADYYYKEESQNLGSGFIIRPSEKNSRAIKAYEKAGFRRVNDKKATINSFLREEFAGEYGNGDYGFENTAVLILSDDFIDCGGFLYYIQDYFV